MGEMMLSDILRENGLSFREFVTTGSNAIDFIISDRADGTGGWPLGSFCEISGNEATGKTFFVLQSVAHFQKRFKDNGFIFYDDTEGAVNYNVAKDLGIDLADPHFVCTTLHPEKTIKLTRYAFKEYVKTLKSDVRSYFSSYIEQGFCSSSTIRECFQRIAAIASIPELKEKRKLFVIDSIAQLASQIEFEAGITIVDQGQRAKELRQGIRLVGPFIYQGNLLLVTNHVIYGSTASAKTTSGGKGLHFASNVRIQFHVADKIVKEGTTVGMRILVKCLKTRWTVPGQEVLVELYFNKGIHRYSGLCDKLVELGYLVKKGGGRFALPDQRDVPGSGKFEREWYELFEKQEFDLSKVSAIGKVKEVVDESFVVW